MNFEERSGMFTTLKTYTPAAVKFIKVHVGGDSEILRVSRILRITQYVGVSQYPPHKAMSGSVIAYQMPDQVLSLRTRETPDQLYTLLQLCDDPEQDGNEDQ